MSFRKREEGSILLSAAALVLVVALLSVTVFNHGKAVNDKVLALNAADAAAYSSAVWAARNLNFIAYTNRAIYLNHAVIGHLVSYLSWLRFYGLLSNGVGKVARFIPYAGAAVESLNQAIQEGISVTETTTAPFMLESVTFLNNLYFTTQKLSRIQGVVTLKEVMEKTAKAHHPEIRVNDPRDLAAVSGELLHIKGYHDLVSLHKTELKDLGQCMKMYWDYYAFVSAFTPLRDIEHNRKKRSLLMTEKTIFGMQVDKQVASSGMLQKNWYSNRDWTFRLLLVDILRKRGKTELFYYEGKVDWFATDYLDRIFSVKILEHASRWFTGRARASEFAIGGEYKGFPGYHELSRETKSDQRLQFSALTSIPFSAISSTMKSSSDSHGERLMALSTAEVYYRRPVKDRTFKRGFKKPPNTEYPNLFNPFWHARLI